VTHWIHPDAEAELGDAAVYYAANVFRTNSGAGKRRPQGILLP
jgi:hypothetical protein